MGRFYRVEKNGQGMFRYTVNPSMELRDKLSEDMDGRHPMPHDDSALVRNVARMEGYVHGRQIFWTDYLYGFSSLEQLKSWIYKDEVRVGLHSLGFTIGVYEYDWVAYGDTQAVVHVRLQQSEDCRIETLSLLDI